MKEVRMGVIGLGNMGMHHARSLEEGKIPRARLTAVCDTEASMMEPYKAEKFSDSAKLIRSGLVDAILIATPHYFHPTIGQDAFENGLHVLTEKPLAVHVNAAKAFIAAAEKAKTKKFGIVFHTRTHPVFYQIKQLVESGQLGELTRVAWTITDWYRTEAYYSSGGWRATWAGEGGGVLINQAPHNLDLLQWICGMPKSVRAFCKFGKYHDIETEDEATAYFEFENGATGIFITSTGEAPGINRLEILGKKGKITLENNHDLKVMINEVASNVFSKTSPKAYDAPPVKELKMPSPPEGGTHNEVIEKFVAAILDDTPLVAEAAEGIRQVELSNAILYSALTGSTVILPLDGDAFEEKLKELIANSTLKKKIGSKIQDLASYIKK
jgi:predicted dehydrogenase